MTWEDQAYMMRKGTWEGLGNAKLQQVLHKPAKSSVRLGITAATKRGETKAPRTKTEVRKSSTSEMPVHPLLCFAAREKAACQVASNVSTSI